MRILYNVVNMLRFRWFVSFSLQLKFFSLSVIYDMVMNVVCFASFDTLLLGCDCGLHHQKNVPFNGACCCVWLD